MTPTDNLVKALETIESSVDSTPGMLKRIAGKALEDFGRPVKKSLEEKLIPYGVPKPNAMSVIRQHFAEGGW